MDLETYQNFRNFRNCLDCLDCLFLMKDSWSFRDALDHRPSQLISSFLMVVTLVPQLLSSFFKLVHQERRIHCQSHHYHCIENQSSGRRQNRLAIEYLSQVFQGLIYLTLVEKYPLLHFLLTWTLASWIGRRNLMISMNLKCCYPLGTTYSSQFPFFLICFPFQSFRIQSNFWLLQVHLFSR